MSREELEDNLIEALLELQRFSGGGTSYADTLVENYLKARLELKEFYIDVRG